MEKTWNTILLIVLLLSCPSPVAKADTSGPFREILYSARFNWRHRPLRFDIGTIDPASLDKSRFRALISSQGETVATCERVTNGDAPIDVNSMSLHCGGKLFGPATANAKFYFAPSLEHPQLLIQSGKNDLVQLLKL